MEPLRSSQTALSVDMTSTAATAQAIKKLKSPRFIPFEPTKAAVGPILREPLTSTPHQPATRFAVPSAQDSSPILPEPKILHRYSKTVVYPRKKPIENAFSSAKREIQFETASEPIVSQLAQRSDKNRPINVVDPIRSERQQTVLTIVGDETEMDETYESRAVAHLQSVNDAYVNKITQLRDERSELKKELECQFQVGRSFHSDM